MKFPRNEQGEFDEIFYPTSSEPIGYRGNILRDKEIPNEKVLKRREQPSNRDDNRYKKIQRFKEEIKKLEEFEKEEARWLAGYDRMVVAYIYGRNIENHEKIEKILAENEGYGLKFVGKCLKCKARVTITIERSMLGRYKARKWMRMDGKNLTRGAIVYSSSYDKNVFFIACNSCYKENPVLVEKKSLVCNFQVRKLLSKEERQNKKIRRRYEYRKVT